MLAGYTGSVVEFGIMRFVDFMMSLPGILVVLLLAFALGPGLPVAAHHDPQRPPAMIAAHGHELRDQAPSAAG